jgi:hypothetical protein
LNWRVKRGAISRFFPKNEPFLSKLDEKGLRSLPKAENAKGSMKKGVPLV